MCPPAYLSTRIPNNVWMKQEKIDVPRALKQYYRIKRMIRSLGVPILEIPPRRECQDQMYVANIGIAIKPYIILANYKAPGRACEVEPAREFFESEGYTCIQPPFHFEGEADLKPLRDGIYFGGHGQFTDPRALDWIAEQTGIEIVHLHETSEKLYHMDCGLHVLDEKHVIITETAFDKDSIQRIEEVANVFFAPDDIATTGITNGVNIPERRIFLSGTYNPELPEYRKAMDWLFNTMDTLRYSVILLDCDEFDKSGADLSCCIFHLTF